MVMQLYGLKRCSTCVKARKWLEAQGHEVPLIDVRETPQSAEQYRQWAAEVGWDKLINRASQTWRQLDEATRQQINETLAAGDDSMAVELLQQQPSLMKRPLLVHPKGVLLGFSEATYAELLSQ